jgi:excisionase family DNA binding protein
MVPLLVSIDEAASALRLSKHTIIKWMKLGIIPSVKLGSRRLISSDDLKRIARDGLTSTTVPTTSGSRSAS